MNDDDFTTAARAEAERLTPEGTSVPVLRTERDNLVHMAEWARTYLAEQGPQVTILQKEGRPATCEVRKNGVLIFSGRDYTEEINL